MLRAARAAALLAAARAEGGAAASTSGSSGTAGFSSSFSSSSSGERRGGGMLFFFARSLASTPAPAPAVDEIECTVNGKTVTIPKGANVMAACDAAGVDIPRFCYHQRLSIAGNCRMCLVEVEKSPKPVASCAMPAMPGMKISTDTPLVKKAREGVMEFLLINHPLDCPICDQGGECDLQDQSLHFGSDRGRFSEAKRGVPDKNVGPLVKTVMTRCIHCTRCVRFATEVAGVPELGITGRGNASEVGTYVEKALTSELSGNVIDLCPVGALTSKPYAFTARQWELKGTESVDISDALGAAVRVDSRGPEVMRIVPLANDAVNEEWLSDKGRFQYDGLKRQRLGVPMVRRQSNGDGAAAPQLVKSSWEEALGAAAAALADAAKTGGANSIRAVAGKLADVESMVALKDLLARLGSGDCTYEDATAEGVDVTARGNYTLATPGAGVSAVPTGAAALDGAGAILLVGVNPRVECAVLNARLRRAWLGGTKIGFLGAAGTDGEESIDLTYPYTHVGTSADALSALAKGEGDFAAALKEAAASSSGGARIIVGSSAATRGAEESAAIADAAHELAKSLGGKAEVGFLHNDAARVGAADVGFARSARAAAAAASGTSALPRVVFLLNSDDYDESLVPDGAFVIYQGHHGERGAARADVVLPGSAFTEKDATFVSATGAAQRTRAAVPRVGDAREDWKILRALSEVAGAPLPYDDAAAMRARLAEIAPHLAAAARGAVPEASPVPTPGLAAAVASAVAGSSSSGGKKKSSKLSSAPLVPRLGPLDFHQTDVISRTSVVMAKAAASKRESAKVAEESQAMAA